jgi:hypothetical protein
MAFFLSSQNISEYLVQQNISIAEKQKLSKFEIKVGKNFNLLVSFQDSRKLLVKQERHDQEGKTTGEFLSEWQIQEFLQRTPELYHIRPLMSEVLHFDANHSIIVFNYLNEYSDLADFYTKENIYSTEMATSIGTALATIHRATLDRQQYQDFFSQNSEGTHIDQAPKFASGLERISPEIFGHVPADGLKFFALYQRYDSLGKAIAQLATAFESCCLRHNDFKLNNILLHTKIEGGY